ncbi:MAG: hypothetical protein ACT4PE_07955 [Candidatus Eiseniibacteriota bacterium]
MTPLLAERRTAAKEDAPSVANPKQTVILLGPQGRRETLADVLQQHGITGRLATITAGWQEREDEVRALDDHLQGQTENLLLHRRGEEIFAADPELEKVHHDRQRRLRELRRLYNVRLEHAMAAILELSRRRSQSDLADEEWRSALEALREIDRAHLARVAGVHEEFESKLRLAKRAEVKRHRKEIAAALKRCSAVAIAGGHLAVLLNRLRLFGFPEAAGQLPFVAWSGGAMVVCERVVVYHDNPPWGPGHAEVFEVGLGLVRGVVALPHARERLRLGDPDRVARFALRFAPARCLAMDEGAWLSVGPKGWSASPETKRMTAAGLVEGERR